MKYLRNARAALSALVAAGLVAVVPVANAAIDISTELTAAEADLTTVITGVGGMLIAMAALGIGFRWAVRLLGR